MMKLILVFTVFICCAHDAHAYLDGGSGSMLLQLLLGGAAGSAAIIRLYWDRIKAFFSKKKDK